MPHNTQNTNVVRAFFGIPLTPEIVTDLTKIKDVLQNIWPQDVKWVKAAMFHITLQFLGEIPQDIITDLCARTKENISKQKPFQIDLAQVGAFPNMQRPRVIIIGCQNAGKEFNEVSKIIASTTAQFPMIKPTTESDIDSMHVTLGRVRQGATLSNFAEKTEECKTKGIIPTKPILGTMVVSKIILYKSQLQNGPIYSSLADFPL